MDSLQQRAQQPKDVLPALPVRPTSRARLPSTLRLLPVNFEVGYKPHEYLPSDSGERKERKDDCSSPADKESGPKRGLFGSKKLLKIEPLSGSPYDRMMKMENCEERSEETEDLDSGSVPSSAPPPLMEECGWVDIRNVLKKVRSYFWDFYSSDLHN